jgi:hypothetical protein
MWPISEPIFLAVQKFYYFSPSKSSTKQRGGCRIFSFCLSLILPTTLSGTIEHAHHGNANEDSKAD